MKSNTKLTIMGALISGVLPLIAAVDTKSKSDTHKYYTVLKSIEEHDRACKSPYPTVIMYNSSSCSACNLMEPGLNDCAQRYKKAKFYVVNAEDPALKEKIHKKVKIEAYPTTYFRKRNEEPNVQRGSIEAEELDGIVYKFVNGKPKPFNSKAKSTAIKKSLQEDQE